MIYQKLLEKVHEIHDLRKAVRVLTWDREIAMPAGGDSARIRQIATLQRISHALFTTDAMGRLIDDAAEELDGQPYWSAEASLVRFLKREYARARCLTAEFVSHRSTLQNQARAAWRQSRDRADFTLFQPWLEKIVDLNRELAERYGYEHEPYDALLSQHEPGATTRQVHQLFEATRLALQPLVHAVQKRGDVVDDSCVQGNYPIRAQEKLCRYLASQVGYDFQRGVLATAVHPFSTSLARDDVRITTRYNETFLSPSIFAAVHEAGHAIYVQNVDPALARTPLAKETSAGLDESQSRLMENMVGRSRGFWRAHFAKAQECFPDELGDVTVEQFYRAINKVQPGFIRVEADELTYNFHIFLRFEIELALLDGALRVADLPAAWNERMEELLGIRPSNDREGCLQDIHWTMVGFGYFPTYSLGNLYAAQLYESALEQVPQLESELKEGQLGGLLLWLCENVHRYGRMFEAAEIIKAATGRPLDHTAYLRYLTGKFSRIYELPAGGRVSSTA